MLLRLRFVLSVHLEGLISSDIIGGRDQWCQTLIRGKEIAGTSMTRGRAKCARRGLVENRTQARIIDPLRVVRRAPGILADAADRLDRSGRSRRGRGRGRRARRRSRRARDERERNENCESEREVLHFREPFVMSVGRNGRVGVLGSGIDSNRESLAVPCDHAELRRIDIDLRSQLAVEEHSLSIPLVIEEREAEDHQRAWCDTHSASLAAVGDHLRQDSARATFSPHLARGCVPEPGGFDADADDHVGEIARLSARVQDVRHDAPFFLLCLLRAELWRSTTGREGEGDERERSEQCGKELHWNFLALAHASDPVWTVSLFGLSAWQRIRVGLSRLSTL